MPSAWEYSVRRYLKGFSDAIVPSGSTPMKPKSKPSSRGYVPGPRARWQRILINWTFAIPKTP